MTNTTSNCRIPDRISGHWLIVLTAVGGVVGVICVVGNGIVILAYITTKTLRKPSNLLLTNLSLSDLLYGLVGFPVYVLTDFVHHLYCSWIFYPARIFTLYLLINMQLNNMTLIALERFLGIQFPFFYQTHVTTFRVFIAVCCTWFLGIGRAFFMSAVYKENLQLGLNVELPVLVFLVILSFLVYCRVYFVSKGHLKKDKHFGIRNQESKSQVAVLIALFNTISWMPVVLVRLAEVFPKNTGYWKQATFLSPFVGTCFNLVIYTYRMKEYRDAVKRLIGRRNIVAPFTENN